MMHSPGSALAPGSPPPSVLPSGGAVSNEDCDAHQAARGRAGSGVGRCRGSGRRGLKTGTPELKSATALAFGPKGLLFVGDSGRRQRSSPIDTGDTKAAGDKPLNVEKIDSKIAAALGVTDKDVRINDVKVNPASGNVYLGVTRGTGAGTPARASRWRATAPSTAAVAQGRAVRQGEDPEPGDRRGRRARRTSSRRWPSWTAS